MIYKTTLIAALITLFALSYIYSQPNPQSPCPLQNYSQTIVSINQQQLQTEIADTEPARQCGLAFRKELPTNFGMLFIFDEAQPLQFWMKDTLIPITVAYIDENKTITEIHNMRPEHGEKTFYSKQKARYALESSPEWFSNNQIKIGDTVRFDIK